MSFKAYIKEEKSEANKHVPHITINGNDVTVKCGKTDMHPTSEAHYGGYIKLFGQKDAILFELGTAQFWPGMCNPVALFSLVDIKKYSKLVAVFYCNTHGIFENEIAV